MLKPEIQTLLNKQINVELQSAYIYLSMSTYFEAQNLSGMAHWMRQQWQEEVGHAMKIYKYIIERGGDVKLGAIDEPKAEWKSALDAFETAYAHEQFVTGTISDLVDASIKENDHATTSFLRWFVDEQVEEEAQSLDIVDTLKMVGDAPMGVFMLDRQLAQRGG
jgi:ferritin